MLVHDGCTTAGIGCIDCKKRFHENLKKVLDPIRTRYGELSGDGRKHRIHKHTEDSKNVPTT